MLELRIFIVSAETLMYPMRIELMRLGKTNKLCLACACVVWRSVWAPVAFMNAAVHGVTPACVRRPPCSGQTSTDLTHNEFPG